MLSDCLHHRCRCVPLPCETSFGLGLFNRASWFYNIFLCVYVCVWTWRCVCVGSNGSICTIVPDFSKMEILKTFLIYLSIHQNMIRIHEKLTRIWFNSEVQRLCCVGLISALCFGFTVLFCVFGPCLPGKIWQASECIPSRSASACCWPAKHTYTNTHTVTCELGISSTCLSPGSWDACQLHRPSGQPENHRVCLWSDANYSSLKKQEKKEISPANY